MFHWPKPTVRFILVFITILAIIFHSLLFQTRTYVPWVNVFNVDRNEILARSNKGHRMTP